MNTKRGIFCWRSVALMAGLVLFVGAASAQVGEPDHTWGEHGLVTTSFTTTSEGDNANAVEVYPSSSAYAGKILVAGCAEKVSDTYDQFIVARYNADGTLDTTFNSPNGYQTVSFGSYFDRCYDVAIQSDNKIVLVGTHDSNPFAYDNLAIARLNADGSMDTGFSGDGKLAVQIGSTFSTFACVVVQKDGKILVGGQIGQLRLDDRADNECGCI